MTDRAIQRNKENIPILRIAGLTVAIAGAEILWELGRDYIAKGISDVDIAFDATDDAMILKKDNPLVHWDDCCYVASARKFYSHMLPFSGFVLHASTVVLDGKAYLFSADSGTGKSTHTALWQKYFGSDRAYILNDDKPVIRKVDGKFIAFGAPWCGSSRLGVNGSAPIQGVAFLEQAESNWIIPIQPIEALPRLLRQMEQTLLPKGITMLLSILEDFITTIPMYRMGCTISKNAVLTAYSAMSQKAGETKCKQVG